MAIGFRANSGSIFSANSFTPAIPVAQVTGDMMLLFVMGKPYNLGVSITGATGWASAGRGESGTTAAGVDTGSMMLEVFYKEATSDTETNPTVTEGSPLFNICGAWIVVLSKGAGEVWETPVVVFGADETNGTGVAVTFPSDPGVVVNDWVLCHLSVNTDAMGPFNPDAIPTQTGVTFDATGMPTALEAETTTGGDMAGHTSFRKVTVGPGTAPPQLTATGAVSGGADRLEAAFVRLRVTADTDAEISALDFLVPDAAQTDAEISALDFLAPDATDAEISALDFLIPSPADTDAEIAALDFLIPDVPVTDTDAEIATLDFLLPDSTDVEISALDFLIPDAATDVEISALDFLIPSVGELPFTMRHRHGPNWRSRIDRKERFGGFGLGS